MKHKCDGCRYKGEHQEMMFRPMGVCNRGANLVEAVQNYEAEKCPYKKTNADRIRAMSDEELAKFVASKIVNLENHKMMEQGHIPTATQLSALGAIMYDTLVMWLKQPAEVQE